MAKSINDIIWYISKYAITPEYGNPTRQYFLAKYFSNLYRKVTLVSSVSSQLNIYPDLGFKNHKIETSGNLSSVLLSGPKIKLGFSLIRIWSWLVFEFRLLIWAIFSKKEKPDVIIVSSLSLLTFLTGVFLKKYFKCKLVCEVRDIWPLTIVQTNYWNANNLFIKILSYVEYLGYKNADIIIGTMPNLRQHVKRVHEKSYNKVHCIPMGYDPDFYEKNIVCIEDPFLSIFTTKVPDGYFTVGYAGTIGFVNYVDQIIKAAALLKEKKIIFLLLGNGSKKVEITDQVANLHLENVIFIDSVEKKYVQLFLNKCDLLIHPIGDFGIYDYGVSPNKWIDYMYSSRPILVSYNGYRSIINDANCGSFVEANNPVSLSNAIIEFSMKTKIELDEIGLRGKNYLEENHNYATLSNQYLRIIDSI